MSKPIDPQIQAFAHSAVALTRAMSETRRQLAAAFEIALVADAAKGGQTTDKDAPTETETTTILVNGAIRDYVLRRAESHPDTPVDLRTTVTQLQVVDAITKVLVGDEAEQPAAFALPPMPDGPLRDRDSTVWRRDGAFLNDLPRWTADDDRWMTWDNLLGMHGPLTEVAEDGAR